MKHETLIIGGGASALMLASLLPPNSATLIESNPTLGAKMLLSGGGKCNITNAVMESTFFQGDAPFIDSVLEQFTPEHLLAWLATHHLTPVIRNATQYFCKQSAKEIVSILSREARRQRICLGESVRSVVAIAEGFEVVTTKQTLRVKQVVVASGGLSFPKIGASGIGYTIAQSLGHTPPKTTPALVGLTVQPEQFFFKELSGTSTDVVIRVGEQEASGALLFTHKGLSGPAVLDASLYWEKGTISIDFLPTFNLKEVKKSKKQLTTLLPLPKRIAKAFLLQFGLADKSGDACSAEDLRCLERLKCYTFAPAGTFGYSKAEVTRGGVLTREVDRKTMMSQKVAGVYFIGEVLDVAGRVGGYNFQWAFSSAYVCAESLKNRKKR